MSINMLPSGKNLSPLYWEDPLRNLIEHPSIIAIDYTIWEPDTLQLKAYLNIETGVFLASQMTRESANRSGLKFTGRIWFHLGAKPAKLSDMLLLTPRDSDALVEKLVAQLTV